MPARLLLALVAAVLIFLPSAARTLDTAAQPLWPLPPTASVHALVRLLLLDASIALGVVWLVQLMLGGIAPAVSRKIERWAASATAHPWITLPLAAFVATILSCYPTLVLDRSLVSPNNGAAPMLYDSPPLVPGSADVLIEDVRASDVGAAMWTSVPCSRVQREAIARGEVPLWNRYNSAGVSLWGQGRTAMLDPLYWIALITPDPALGWDLTFAGHRFVASWGVGVAAFMAIGAVAPASLVAIASAFVGVYASRVNDPATFVLTYAPWVLAGWFLLASATDRRHHARAAVLLIAATSLMLVASPPTEALVTLLVVWSIGLLTILIAPSKRGGRWPRLLTAVVSALTVVLVTAPHWWIVLDTLRASLVAYDASPAPFTDRATILALTLGPLAPASLLPGLQTVTIAGVVAALLSPKRLFAHRPTLACVLVIAATLALASDGLSRGTLGALAFVGGTPTLRIALLTAALTPLLVVSALGAQAMLQASRVSVTVFTIVMAACAAWVFGEIDGWRGMGRLEVWLTLFALGGAIALPGSLRSAARSFPRVLPLLAVAALAILLIAPGGQQPRTGLAAIDKVLVQPRLRVPLADSAPVLDAVRDAAPEPARVIALGDSLAAGTSSLYSLEGITGRDVLQLPHFRELLDASTPPVAGDGMRTFTRADVDRVATALDILNVGFIVGAPREFAADDRPLPMGGPDRLQAVSRPGAWPRAFFIDRVETHTTTDELLAQAREAGHAIASVFSGDAIATTATQEISSGPAEPIPATQYRLTTNSTTFRVEAPHAGVVVLAESYMADDFVATLNGTRVPYFRVNHAGKGVIVPGAGDWEVRFVYRPRHWDAALAAASAGVGIFLVLAIVSGRG